MLYVKPLLMLEICSNLNQPKVIMVLHLLSIYTDSYLLLLIFMSIHILLHLMLLQYLLQEQL